jgi:hypothetical protein
MHCNCDCHKVKDKTDLKKCQESNKKKSRELNELRRKLLVATIAIAVVGTLVGKETVDKVLEYFQTFDKVKQTIERVDGNDIKYSFPPHAVYGSSPSPSTLGVFAIAALLPVARRT